MTLRPNNSDAAAVHRAGRTAALQASAALAAVLLIVGAVVFGVDVRVQSQQIAAQLTSVASTADDVTDPPPGMILLMRDNAGNIAVGVRDSGAEYLLDGPPGFSDIRIGERHYRALVADNDHGRVVALLDLAPYEAGRSRLLHVAGNRGTGRHPGVVRGRRPADPPFDPAAHASVGPATSVRRRRIARTARAADGAEHPRAAHRPPFRSGRDARGQGAHRRR